MSVSFVTLGAYETMLYLHTNRAPTYSEWADSMSHAEMAVRRFGVQRFRVLVISDGGGPDIDMRAELKTLYARQRFVTPTAVIAASALVRGVVGAINFFNPSIKSFSPRGLDDALRFLDIPLSARSQLLDAARALQATLPLNTCLKLLESAQWGPEG